MARPTCIHTCTSIDHKALRWAMTRYFLHHTTRLRSTRNSGPSFFLCSHKQNCAALFLLPAFVSVNTNEVHMRCRGEGCGSCAADGCGMLGVGAMGPGVWGHHLSSHALRAVLQLLPLRRPTSDSHKYGHPHTKLCSGWRVLYTHQLHTHPAQCAAIMHGVKLDCCCPLVPLHIWWAGLKVSVPVCFHL